MWILFLILYLLGVFITASVTGYLEIDFDDNPLQILYVIGWPFLFVIVFLFGLCIIPYYIGLWVKKYKGQIDLKSYLKEIFLK